MNVYSEHGLGHHGAHLSTHCYVLQNHAHLGEIPRFY